MTTLDSIVVGGGIAGLWALTRLQQAGRPAILLEAQALGAGQTLASQGMVHGGLKYALGASLSGAAEAIANMPQRWRACLAGSGEVDLTGLAPLATRYYMFAQSSTLGRLTGFFASRSLRGRIEKLSASDYPEAFQHPNFSGIVYGLNDFVLHTPSLLEHLAQQQRPHLYQHRLQASEVELGPQEIGANLAGCQVRAKHLIIAAGAGTQTLLTGLGINEPTMQRRALHQVVVRAPNLPPLYAHCLTGITRAEPRLTITSHRDTGGQWLWYLGGQLATDGVDRSDAQQALLARQELETCAPWLDWSGASFSSLRIDRAEPAQQGGQRPDEAFVQRCGRVVVAWPTKLSLVPDLADQLLAELDPCSVEPATDGTSNISLPQAALAQEPWLG